MGLSKNLQARSVDLAILLRDGGASDRLEVTDFTRLLLQPAIDALPAAADDDIPQPGN